MSIYIRPQHSLTASLANFCLYAAIDKATITRVDIPAPRGGVTQPGYRIHIFNVGIYGEDTFDFNDDKGAEGKNKSQYLGHWSKGALLTNFTARKQALANGSLFLHNRKFSIMENGQKYNLVTNRDYRDYRNSYGKGGDFFLFSDIKKIPVDILLTI